MKALTKVLGIDWIFGRWEAQTRSSIHFHAMLKLKNDPGLHKLALKATEMRMLLDKKLEAAVKGIPFEWGEKQYYGWLDGMAIATKVSLTNGTNVTFRRN